MTTSETIGFCSRTIHTGKQAEAWATWMALAKRRGEVHREEGDDSKTEGKSRSAAQSPGTKAYHTPSQAGFPKFSCVLFLTSVCRKSLQDE